MASEKWLAIKDFPGYEVSLLGSVRSYYKRTGKTGWILSSTPQRTLSATKHTKDNRYPSVLLKHKSGKWQLFSVHRLVAQAFLGEAPSGLEVCHNDGDPTNNSLDNLRYDTHESNVKDALKHGKYHRKATESQVLEIRQRRNTGETNVSIAKNYDLCIGTIQDINSGKTHKHIGGPLTSGYHYKLSNVQIKEMRLLKQKGLSHSELANEFGVDQSFVSLVVRGLRRLAAGGPIGS